MDDKDRGKMYEGADIVGEGQSRKKVQTIEARRLGVNKDEGVANMDNKCLT